MIHRQLSRWKFLATMITDAGRALALPPLARAQLARLLPLAANLFFGDLNKEAQKFHIDSLRTRAGEKASIDHPTGVEFLFLIRPQASDDCLHAAGRWYWFFANPFA